MVKTSQLEIDIQEYREAIKRSVETLNSFSANLGLAIIDSKGEFPVLEARRIKRLLGEYEEEDGFRKKLISERNLLEKYS